VLPGLFEAASSAKEHLGEIRSQIEKQRARVKELRERKLTEPGVSIFVTNTPEVYSPKV
jgi:hypothetical protein